MSIVNLNKNEIEKIANLLKKFPDVDRFQLREHGQSGIGSLLDMILETEINGVRGKLTISISDESSW